MSGGLGASSYEMMSSYAKRCKAMQKSHPGDFRNTQGILICGICKKPREKIMLLPNPTIEDKKRVSKLIVPIQCQCEMDAFENGKKDRETAQNAERIKKLKASSLMDAKFSNASFDRFSQTSFNQRNLKVCMKYVAEFDKMASANQGLLFWGGVGTGKSYTAACIANSLMEKGVPVVMTSFVKILEAIQATGQEASILSNMNSAKLVIFDDLGAERGTDYTLEKIYNIVDSRYRKRLPMILTTNLTLPQMKEEMDDRYRRIYDRIIEVCYPMQFTGPSWRKKEASRRFKDMAAFLGDV